jgi:hypothetical protein
VFSAAILPLRTTTPTGLFLLRLDFYQSAHYFVSVVVQNTHRTLLVLHLHKGVTLPKLNFDDLSAPFKKRPDVGLFVVIRKIAYIKRVHHAASELFPQIFYSCVR